MRPACNDLISWPTKHCVPQRAGHIADALAEAAGVADDAIDVIAEYDSMRKALIAEYNLNTEAGRVLLPNGRHLVDDIRRFIEGGGKVEPK